MLMSELTAPKLTLIPHNRVPPTIRSLSSLSPVTKLNQRQGHLPGAHVYRDKGDLTVRGNEL